MASLKAEVVGFKECGEKLPYETGRVVQNWAQTFECRPERFYLPKNEDQVIEVVNLARQLGKTIRVVGAAHSPSDIHCSSEWMMSLDHLDNVLSHDLDRRIITVQAGMRLYKYINELERRGWSMDNLGSISDQSMAGAIATCTHGSSMEYGVISTQKVEEITLVLANGTITTCSLDNDPDLFRAALVSLGSLGIIIRLTMRATPKYTISYTTETVSLERFLAEYNQIWSSATYVRAWWWPYNRKVIIWRGNRTHLPETVAKHPASKWYSNFDVGKKVYEASLYALTYTPSLLPSFEKALFNNQFPAPENVISDPEVDNAHKTLQMDCLFSQYVDEWAVPLSSGIEAMSRLDRWISHGDTSAETGIPIDTSAKVYVHAPIEIRVSSGRGDHAFLSPAREGTPVIWLGVIMYRPYYSPVAYRKYFSAYEHLMRSLGGKPHWAKQNRMSAAEAEHVFGDGMTKWLEVRARVDPSGVFVNGFVKRHLLGIASPGKENVGVGIMDGESGRLFKRYRAVL